MRVSVGRALSPAATTSHVQGQLHQHSSVEQQTWHTSAASGVASDRHGVCVCRIVQWEDGSMQLFVGSEVLDLQPRDNSANNTHLFARHKEVMQVGALDLQPVAYHASPLRWCVCLEHPPASWCWRSWLWQPR